MEEWHARIVDSTTLSKIISPSGYSAASAISPNCGENVSPPPHETLLYLIIPLLFCWQSQMNAISTAAVSTGHISDSVDQPLQGDRQ